MLSFVVGDQKFVLIFLEYKCSQQTFWNTNNGWEKIERPAAPKDLEEVANANIEEMEK